MAEVRPRCAPAPCAAHGDPVGSARSVETVDLGEPAKLDPASRIVVTEDGSRFVSGGLTRGTVGAQNVATGAQIWSAALGDAVFDVAVGGDVVVAALGLDGEAVVLDLATGAIGTA